MPMGSAEVVPGSDRSTTPPPAAAEPPVDRAGDDANVQNDGKVQKDGNVQVADVDTTDAATFVLATFPDLTSESRAYRGLMKARAYRDVRLRRVIVVRLDEAHGIEVETPLDRSPWVGIKYGLIGGAAVAMFIPPPILVTMFAFGTMGGALGKASQWLQRARLRRTLKGLLRSEAAIIAVVPAGDLEATLAAMPGAIDVETGWLDDEPTARRT
jgi:hypothetical protein